MLFYILLSTALSSNSLVCTPYKQISNGKPPEAWNFCAFRFPSEISRMKITHKGNYMIEAKFGGHKRNSRIYVTPFSVEGIIYYNDRMFSIEGGMMSHVECASCQECQNGVESWPLGTCCPVCRKPEVNCFMVHKRGKYCVSDSDLRLADLPGVSVEECARRCQKKPECGASMFFENLQQCVLWESCRYFQKAQNEANGRQYHGFEKICVGKTPAEMMEAAKIEDPDAAIALKKKEDYLAFMKKLELKKLALNKNVGAADSALETPPKETPLKVVPKLRIEQCRIVESKRCVSFESVPASRAFGDSYHNGANSREACIARCMSMSDCGGATYVHPHGLNLQFPAQCLLYTTCAQFTHASATYTAFAKECPSIEERTPVGMKDTPSENAPAAKDTSSKGVISVPSNSAVVKISKAEGSVKPAENCYMEDMGNRYCFTGSEMIRAATRYTLGAESAASCASLCNSLSGCKGVAYEHFRTVPGTGFSYPASCQLYSSCDSYKSAAPGAVTGLEKICSLAAAKAEPKKAGKVMKSEMKAAAPAENIKASNSLANRLEKANEFSLLHGLQMATETSTCTTTIHQSKSCVGKGVLASAIVRSKEECAATCNEYDACHGAIFYDTYCVLVETCSQLEEATSDKFAIQKSCEAEQPAESTSTTCGMQETPNMICSYDPSALLFNNVPGVDSTEACAERCLSEPDCVSGLWSPIYPGGPTWCRLFKVGCPNLLSLWPGETGSYFELICTSTSRRALSAERMEKNQNPLSNRLLGMF